MIRGIIDRTEQDRGTTMESKMKEDISARLR